METYLESLNAAQKEAVLATEGPLLIVAGAGAGKTKTLTTRIIHLIHGGVLPEHILAITFTKIESEIVQPETSVKATKYLVGTSGLTSGLGLVKLLIL